MQDFVKNFDDIISLGNNCYPKMYLERYLNIKKEYDFFDYIGTPMWSIVKLLKNNFNNLFIKDEFKLIKIWYDSSDCYVANSIYNFKFRHDLIEYPVKDDIYNHFKDKYQRRKNRFISKINNSKKILFVRLEEQLTNKIIPENLKDKYKDNEYDYIKEFISEIKKINPKLDITVIYLSPKFKNNYIKEDNIITLECDIYQRGDNVVGRLSEVFDKHSEYIKSIVV